MTIDQHIAELRAELSGSILTAAERTTIKAELEQALHAQDRVEDEFELMLMAEFEDEDLAAFGIDPDFDELGIGSWAA